MNNKSELTKEQKESIELLGNLPKKIPKKYEELRFEDLPLGELKVEKIHKKVNKLERLSVEDEIKLLETFTIDDALKPSMEGVYLDGNEGALVATDASKLFCIFDKTIKGSKSQIVNPENGEIIDFKYPDYKAIIPQETPPKLFINVENTLDIAEGIVRANKFFRDYDANQNIKLRIEYNSESYFYNANYFVDCLKLLLQLGYETVGIELIGKNSFLVIRTNDVLVIILPINIYDFKSARYVTIPHSNEKQNQLRSKALSNKETADNSLNEYYKLDFSSSKINDIKSLYNPELTDKENALLILKNPPKKIPKKNERIDINNLPLGEIEINEVENVVKRVPNPTVEDEIKLLAPFVSNDVFGEKMRGVYFDSNIGALVAIDGHRMSMIFDNRIVGLGSKIINPKDGKKIESEFVDYQKIIPNEPMHTLNVNCNDVLDVAQAVLKANKFFTDFNPSENKSIMVTFEGNSKGYFYNPDFIVDGFKFLLQLGHKDVIIEISDRNFLVVRTNDSLILICPLKMEDNNLEKSRYVTIKGVKRNKKSEPKIAEPIIPELSKDDIRRLIKTLEILAKMGDNDAKTFIRSLKLLLD